MHTIHLKTIVPDRLYQRGQFVTFPVEAKMQMLEAYKIDVVVNLWSRPDPELHQHTGLIYLHWPIGGSQPPVIKWPLIHALVSYMNEGKRVLVHCEAGVNRSIWLSAILKARFELISGQDAFAELLHHVGRTKLRPGLMADLASLPGPGGIPA